MRELVELVDWPKVSGRNKQSILYEQRVNRRYEKQGNRNSLYSAPLVSYFILFY